MMNLRTNFRIPYFLTPILVLLLCDCIEPQDITDAPDNSSISFEIENYLTNDQTFKFEVEGVSAVTAEIVVTPKKIGEMEFDVEVHEVLPQKEYSLPPEIVAMSEKYSNDSSDKSWVQVEVLTNMAVDLVASPKKIGDIQLDIEVENVVPKEGESRAPEIVVKPERGDTVLHHFNRKGKDLDYSQTVANFQLKDSSDLGIRPFQAILDDTFDATPDSDSSATASSSSDSRAVTEVISISDLSNQTDISVTDSMASDTLPDPGISKFQTETRSTEAQTISSTDTKSVPPTSRKPEQKSYAIWPTILVAFIFIVLILIGLFWVLTSFCKVKKLEDEEEKRIAATTAAVAVNKPKPDSSAATDSSGQSIGAMNEQPSQNIEAGKVPSADDSSTNLSQRSSDSVISHPSIQ